MELTAVGYRHWLRWLQNRIRGFHEGLAFPFCAHLNSRYQQYFAHAFFAQPYEREEQLPLNILSLHNLAIYDSTQEESSLLQQTCKKTQHTLTRQRCKILSWYLLHSCKTVQGGWQANRTKVEVTSDESCQIQHIHLSNMFTMKSVASLARA